MATKDTQLQKLLASYSRNTRIRAELAMTVSHALMSAAGDDPPDAQRAALARLHLRAADVDTALHARARVPPARKRALLAAFINAWSALYEALGAFARIPGEISDRGERCARIRRILFADGLRFARSGAVAAWGEGAQMLARIEEEDLGAEIELLLGPEMLLLVRSATEALTPTLDGDGARGRGKIAVAPAVRRFQAAVGDYTRALVHAVDTDDPASIERFLQAIEPLERLGVGRVARKK
jgi:hypothetical protein